MMRVKICLTVLIALSTFLFASEVPNEEPLTLEDHTAVAPITVVLPPELLDSVVNYLTAEDLLHAALTSKAFYGACDRFLNANREKLIALPEKGINGEAWKPCGEVDQIVTCYFTALFGNSARKGGYHEGNYEYLVECIPLVYPEEVYLIALNAHKFFKDDTSLDQRLSILEVLNSLLREEFYILARYADKVFMRLSQSSSLDEEDFDNFQALPPSPQKHRLYDLEIIPIIKILTFSYDLGKLYHICKHADEILENNFKILELVNPQEIFEKTLASFEDITLVDLKIIMDHIPQFTNAFLSLQDIASLRKEKLLFIIKHLDRFFGPNVTSPCETHVCHKMNVSFIIKNLATCKKKYFKNFAELIEATGDNLLTASPFTSKKYQLIDQLLSLSILSDERLRSYIYYINMHFFQLPLKKKVRIVKQWRDIEFAEFIKSIKESAPQLQEFAERMKKRLNMDEASKISS